MSPPHPSAQRDGEVSPATGPGDPGASRRSLALRGGLWSAAGQILPALGTAVLSVAAARYLGSGPLGRQSLIAYVNASLAAVLLVSLRTALLQLGGRLKGEGDLVRLRELERWSVPAHLVVGVLAGAIMAIAGLFATQDSDAWFVIAVVAVLDAGAYGLSVRMILAEGWVGVGRLRLLSQLAGPLLGLALLFTGLGIAGIFLGDGIAAAWLLVVFHRRRRRFAGPASPTPGRRVPATRAEKGVGRSYLLFAVSAVITQVVSKRVEFIVLAIFAGDVAIGMYSVAFMAVNLVGMIPLGIATAALPTVAAAEGSGEMDQAAGHVKVALRVGTLLSIPVVALLAVLGPALIALIYGPAYDTAARLVPLASLGLLLSVIIGLSSQYWSGRGRLGIVLGTGGFAAVADLAVAFALVPPYGATGAVVANLVGQAALGAGLLIATTRELGALGWRALSLARGIGVAAGAVVAVLIVQFLAGRFVASGELRAAIVLLVGTVAGLAAVAGVAIRCKVLDADDAAWLAPLLPRRLAPLLARVSTG